MLSSIGKFYFLIGNTGETGFLAENSVVVDLKTGALGGNYALPGVVKKGFYVFN